MLLVCSVPGSSYCTCRVGEEDKAWDWDEVSPGWSDFAMLLDPCFTKIIEHLLPWNTEVSLLSLFLSTSVWEIFTWVYKGIFYYLYFIRLLWKGNLLLLITCSHAHMQHSCKYSMFSPNNKICLSREWSEGGGFTCLFSCFCWSLPQLMGSMADFQVVSRASGLPHFL